MSLRSDSSSVFERRQINRPVLCSLMLGIVDQSRVGRFRRCCQSRYCRGASRWSRPRSIEEDLERAAGAVVASTLQRQDDPRAAPRPERPEDEV